MVCSIVLCMFFKWTSSGPQRFREWLFRMRFSLVNAVLVVPSSVIIVVVVVVVVIVVIVLVVVIMVIVVIVFEALPLSFSSGTSTL